MCCNSNFPKRNFANFVLVAILAKAVVFSVSANSFCANNGGGELCLLSFIFTSNCYRGKQMLNASQGKTREKAAWVNTSEIKVENLSLKRAKVVILQ